MSNILSPICKLRVCPRSGQYIYSLYMYLYHTVSLYWVTQKLPQIYTANHATFPIRIRKTTVQIFGNIWATKYIPTPYTKPPSKTVYHIRLHNDVLLIWKSFNTLLISLRRLFLSTGTTVSGSNCGKSGI